MSSKEDRDAAMAQSLADSSFDDLASGAVAGNFASPMDKSLLDLEVAANGDTRFIIMAVEDKESDKFENPYVMLTIKRPDNSIHTISDGSTGIMAQVREMQAAGTWKLPMLCKGLRRSDYKNQFGDNTTWYLA